MKRRQLGRSSWPRANPRYLRCFFQLVYSKQFPKASRILVLVRHGQYNLDGTQDSERYLVLGSFLMNFTS